MKQGRTPIEDGTSGDLGLTPPGYDLPTLRGLNSLIQSLMLRRFPL
jgi:hypothetical protein